MTRDDTLKSVNEAFDKAEKLPQLEAELATTKTSLQTLQTENDKLKAQLQAVVFPVAPTPPATPTVGYRELALDERLSIAGINFAAQTPRVKLCTDGSLLFTAKAGERANFDPPRKIRTELIGLTQFAKGQEMRMKGVFNLSPDTVLIGAEWGSIAQIHQADTRRADGVPVNASPMFSVDVLLDASTGKPFLQVRGETGKGEQKTFSPTRILGKLPNIVLGKDYAFEFRVVDGHGSTGRISVWIDGVPVVDRSDIPTGYEYVDLFASSYLIRNQPQSTNSYIKIGIYSGKGAGDVPPPLVNIGLRLSNLSAG